MSCSEECEFNWFIGATGVCSDNNSTCVCPQGFSGNDAWIHTSDSCHVNDLAKFWIYTSVIVVKALHMLVILVGLFTFGKRVFFGKFNPKSKNFKTVQQLTLAWYVFNFFAVVFTIYHDIAAVLDLSMEDQRPFLGLSLGTGLGFAMLSLIALANAWYKCLPDPASYGNLFNLNRFVCKYPNFFPKASIYFGVFHVICLIISFGILPEVIEESQYYQTSAIVVFGYLLGLYIPSFLIVFLVVLRDIIKLYKEGKQRAEELGRDADFVKKMEQIIATTRFFYISCIGSCIATGITSILFIAVNGRYQYLFYGFFVALLGAFMVATFSVAIYFKTNGGLLPLFNQKMTPKQRKMSNLSSPEVEPGTGDL